ncbi:MAG TPA: VCBS repeat-containing protein, partial [Nitrosopumilaceae archaeon]|nr:VCBS repeat-containing protein [Nitrosopumilaceae archaeon]
MKKTLFILSIAIFLNASSQTLCFSPVDTFSIFSNAQPFSVTSADFNGDGNIDLATANNNSNNVSVLLGTGTGIFGTATNFAVGTQPESVTSADFNGDGKKDLAVANYASKNVSVLLGTGTGSFGAATNLTIGINTYPGSIISADFNGDGKVDLATANDTSN